MTKKSFLLIVASSFLLIGASCTNQPVTPTPSPVLPEQGQVTPPPNQGSVNSMPTTGMVTPPPPLPMVSNEKVTIQGFAFMPQTLKIKTGTTVTWTNNDTAPHDIKSTLFLSPRLSQGQTFQYTFDQVGTYDYSCGIHPSMKGQIIVQ